MLESSKAWMMFLLNTKLHWLLAAQLSMTGAVHCDDPPSLTNFANASSALCSVSLHSAHKHAKHPTRKAHRSHCLILVILSTRFLACPRFSRLFSEMFVGSFSSVLFAWLSLFQAKHLLGLFLFHAFCQSAESDRSGHSGLSDAFQH